MPTKADIKIVAIKISGYKRINAFDAKIDPNGSLITIGGQNGQGKSSLLDAIEAALVGPQKSITAPVNKSFGKASVVLKTDKFTVTRTWDPKPSLSVADEMGMPVTQPKEYLQGFLAEFFVDPVAFMQEQPITKREILCNVATPPIDWADYRTSKDEALKEADESKRTYERLKAQASELEEFPGLPEDEISITKLQEQLSEANQVIEHNQTIRQQIASLDGKITLKAEQIADLQISIARLQSEIEACNLAKSELKADDDPDTTEIVRQINDAAETNKKIAQNRFKAQARETAQKALDNETEAARKVQKIENDFKAALASTKFPVPGLGLDDKGVVTFNGVPLDQASQAEQIRVGMAVALAKKGRLAPVLISDGSLLDGKSMRLVAELAEEHGAQVFLERVTDPDSEAEDACTIVIEDGSIKGAKTATEQGVLN